VVAITAAREAQTTEVSVRMRLEVAELDAEPVVKGEGAGVHFHLPGLRQLGGVVGGLAEKAFRCVPHDCLGIRERDVGEGGRVDVAFQDELLVATGRVQSEADRGSPVPMIVSATPSDRRPPRER